MATRFIGREVAPFAGWSWRVFCAMGCKLFYAVLVFPLNAVTEGGFCSMILQLFKIIDDAAWHQYWPLQMRQKWQKLKSIPQWPVRFVGAP